MEIQNTKINTEVWLQKHETEQNELDNNILKDVCRSKAHSFGMK
jgi:hypothetical protein